MQSPAVYRFAGFELDTTRRRLTAPDGTTCPVSSRGYDVLLHLLENRARVVGKDELMSAVWPHTVVEENNLNQAVSSVRRALGDSRDNPRFLLTVAGRGYQFVADVAVVAAIQTAAGAEEDAPGVRATEPPARSTEAPAAEGHALPDGTLQDGSGGTIRTGRRMLLVALGAGAAAVAAGVHGWYRFGRIESAQPRTLAVLPFRPLTDADSDAAIEIGVADLLINRLSTVPDLSVAPLSSVSPFARRDADRASAGRSLAVEAVLDGNVQIRDERVRLTARLTETGSGRILWAGDFTEQLDDFFAVQDSLASQLVDALTPHLPDNARTRALQHESTDVEAWQLYANGRFHLGQRNEASLRKAIDYFSAAIARDPAFARAFAGLSDAWSLMAVFDIEPPGPTFERAREAAARAIRSDPSLPDGHVAMGHVVTQMDRDLAAGRELYRRALDLQPAHAQAHAFLGLNLCQAGRGDAAHDAVARAQQLEPASLAFGAIAGLVVYMARDLDAAEERLRNVLRATPESPLPRHFLVRVLLARGRGAEALELLQGPVRPAPGWRSALGRAYAQTAQREHAIRELATLEALANRGFGTGLDRSLIHLELGNREEALAALEQAVSDHSQVGGYINVEPALDPLRDDPRFQAIAARMMRA